MPSDEYNPEENEDLEGLLAATGAAAGGEDDEYLAVDYDPLAQAMPEGEQPGFLTAIKPSKTKAGKPTCFWECIPGDKKYPFPRSKNIPITEGNGIERLNLEFTRALGLEVAKLPTGQTGIPIKAIRKKILACQEAGMPGIPITMKISHRPRDDGGVWDDLDRILPAQAGASSAPPDLPPADDFGDEPF